MLFYALCVIGWIVLWFRPHWLWLVAAGLIVALPGPVLTAFLLGQDFPLTNLLRNTAISFITGFATFAVPGAIIVALRQWMLARKKDPAPPS
jgi:peptidoglycan/LPS O-acetylase OafA/YrhL